MKQELYPCNGVYCTFRKQPIHPTIMRPISILLIPVLLFALACSSDDNFNHTDLAPNSIDPATNVEEDETVKVAKTLIQDIHLPDAQQSQLEEEVNAALSGIQGLENFEQFTDRGWNTPFGNNDINNNFIPGAGYAFVNLEFVDTSFDPSQPEGFLISGSGENANDVSAVIYIVESEADTPPAGFTGEADVWQYNANEGAWTLYAWVTGDNPNGLFANTNPEVPAR